MLKIRIEHSKTDQLRQRDEVLIARTGSCVCPVTLLECYMKRAGISWEDHRFLFRPVQKTKKEEMLRECGQISYRCLRDLFLKKLDCLGFHLENSVYTACGLEVHLQLPMPKFLIDFKRHV